MWNRRCRTRFPVFRERVFGSERDNGDLAIKAILDRLIAGETTTLEEWETLLALSAPEDREALYEAAYKVKLDTVGPTVYFRGIVELSNICSKDCYYCGIRRSNANVKRYQMSEDEIVRDALWAHEQNYGSIVLQSGERQDKAFVAQITRILKRIKAESNNELGITLSLGEQTEDVYREWFDAGAHRYLLRIETTDPELYRDLHPASHDFETRIACLKLLRSVGYQVGTGVMIGLPGQSVAHLARDIQFFRDWDIDMIGMGPYIPHAETPLADRMPAIDDASQLALGLNMVAVARLVLRDVNIAATTALQALNPVGRELGLQAGANIIMPNLTPTEFREGYQLYDGKPCLDENSAMCQGCLQRRVAGVGETIGLGQWGDSPHFIKRTADSADPGLPAKAAATQSVGQEH